MDLANCIRMNSSGLFFNCYCIHNMTFIMSSFLLDDLQQGNHHNLDHHWRPQYVVCPFCVYNFTIYSKMEELEQDTFYFLTKTKLTERIKSGEKLNSKHDSSSEASFWRQVDMNLINQLEQSWAYGNDFLMFDYTVTEYLESLGLA